jgi:hypothetical protein
MVGFLKGFKNLIPHQVQRIILAVIGLVVLIFELDGNTSDVIDLLGVLLPIGLILFTVFLLDMKKEHFAAHLVLFVAIFSDSILNMIQTLGSYDFFFKEFDEFSLSLIIGFVAAVYLLMMIISMILNDGFKVSLGKPHIFTVLVTSIWIYLCYGFEAAVVLVLTSLIVFGFGCALGGYAILLAPVIVWPLVLINWFINDITKFISIFNWLIAFSSFYIIYLLVMQALKELRKPKQIE